MYVYLCEKEEGNPLRCEFIHNTILERRMYVFTNLPKMVNTVHL